MTVASTLSHARFVAPRFGGIFAGATFVSAVLVFSVEPMVAKMLLPHLGGSPSVWNTSLAFFQAALLAGYAYAHVLQRVQNIRRQMVVHLALLGLAALTLPLATSSILGDPDPRAPMLWLLAQLAMSIGAPFAVLSATAPLVQRWFASSTSDPATGRGPNAYPLYAASNLGSLAALVAYPLVVEPFASLTAQRLGWTAGFYGFVVLVFAIAVRSRGTALTPATRASAIPIAAPSLRDKLVWVSLSAAPSSLIMGVTTHLTTDIASFPFLWLVPLALYLLTFILAFRAKPVRHRSAILLAQSVTVGLCLYHLPVVPFGFAGQLAIHLANFFLTALICHLALADRRPDAAHLTTFYLCLSAGGVLGGAFSALVAPLVFSTIVEYPLVLVLACLARPWNGLALSRDERRVFGLALGAAFLQFVVAGLGSVGLGQGALLADIAYGLLFGAACLSVMLREKGAYFTIVVASLWLAFATVGGSENNLVVERSFFGVLRVSEVTDPVLGPVRVMYHGSTVHGAQSLDPSTACQPLTYYGVATALGQTVRAVQAKVPAVTMAVIGLGTGALASYTRPNDRLTFFEIDPLVAREASDPALFTYLSACSKSSPGIVLGDARLTLGRLPDGELDLLVLDAFSSDTVPAHLLTLEAIRSYFSKLKPEGVLLINATNRHLELRDTIIAGIEAAGAMAVTQQSPKDAGSVLIAAPTTAIVASRTEAALNTFRADRRWSTRDTRATRAWTDDYSNPLGAVIAGFKR